MRFAYKAIALVAALFVSAPAAAADLGGSGGMKDYGELAPPMGWGGFSASFGVGAMFTDASFSYEGTEYATASATAFDFMGRGQYDWQLGHWVFGLYADVNYALNNNRYLNDTVGYGAGVELGYAEGAGKVYTKLGWNRSHLKGKEFELGFDLSKDRDALRVGGGLEYRVSRRLIIFVEGNVDIYPDITAYDYGTYKLSSTDVSALAGIRVPLN